MKFIDLHCDTLLYAAARGERSLYDLPEAMVDVRRLHEAGALAQFFAVFFPPREAFARLEIEPPPDDERYFEICREIYGNTLAEHPDVIRAAGGAPDIAENSANGAVSAFLTLEDGRVIDGKLENLSRFYSLGVRLISLTWNGENCFGFPNSAEPGRMSLGLKPFGIDAVREMNRLGVIVDVSHLSDGGFWDVREHSAKPFVASHSNARTLSPHQRNLTDDMIRALADAGGVAGINYCPAFLNADTDAVVSTAALAVRHIEHIINTGGEDCVSLGGDWDGMDGDVELRGPEKMGILFDALADKGYPGRVIEKIAWGNALRVIAAV
jgi:membrane dipeptidase